MQVLLTTLTVGSSLAVALIIPTYAEKIYSVVGATAVCIVCYVIPVFIQLQCFRRIKNVPKTFLSHQHHSYAAACQHSGLQQQQQQQQVGCLRLTTCIVVMVCMLQHGNLVGFGMVHLLLVVVLDHAHRLIMHVLFVCSCCGSTATLPHNIAFEATRNLRVGMLIGIVMTACSNATTAANMLCVVSNAVLSHIDSTIAEST